VPDQVRVITLNDDAALIDYSQPTANELRANMVRVSSDFTATPVKGKIADAETARVHTMLVIGPRDVEAGNISVRLPGKGNLGAKPKAEAVAEILARFASGELKWPQTAIGQCSIAARKVEPVT
jgi:threonyl-tRNA synthetase